MREDESLTGYCVAAWMILVLIAVSTLAINQRRIADALDRAYPAKERVK